MSDEEKVSPIEALSAASRAYGTIDARSEQPRWGMAVDIERCIGCWSCAVICKSENAVPLGMWWNRILTAGTAIDTPATDEHGRMDLHWLPLACQHCDDAPCEKVGPTSATWINKEGLVLVNQDDCIGCRYCMAACPYGVRVFNWGEAEYPLPEGTGKVAPRPVGRNAAVGALWDGSGVGGECCEFSICARNGMSGSATVNLTGPSCSCS